MKKKYVPFDEDLAEKLQRQFDLKATTLRVWKHRQRIPAKYLDGERPFPERASKAQQARVRKLLELPYLNRAGFEAIPAQRFSDFLREDKPVALRKADVAVFNKELRALRRQIKQVLKKPSPAGLKKVVEQPLLKAAVFLPHTQLLDQLRQERPTWTEERKAWALEHLALRLEELKV